MSTCLLHLYSVPLVNTPVGPPSRRPVGVCSHCHSMTCGWHGVLTTKFLFLCALCSTTSLMSGAMWRWVQAGGFNTLPPDDGESPIPDNADERAYRLALAVAALFTTPARTPAGLVVATFSEWLYERPEYADLMAELLDGGLAAEAVDILNQYLDVGPEPGFEGRHRVRGDYQDTDDDVVRSLWARLDEESRRMFAAALVLMIALNSPGNTLLPRLPLPLRTIYDRVYARLRDSRRILDFCDRVIVLDQQ